MTPKDPYVHTEASYAYAKLYALASDDVGAAILALASKLDGCGGMAGSDDAARQWTAVHDENTGRLLSFAAKVGQALDNFGGMVHQCGVNDEVAEHHVAKQPPPSPPAYPGGSECLFNAPPSALGDNGPGLQGFTDLLNRINVPVPNGDTGKLGAAGDAFEQFAADVGKAMIPLETAHSMSADSAVEAGMPEGEQIMEHAQSMRAAWQGLTTDAHTLAASCKNYATYLSNTRMKIMDVIQNVISASIGTWVVATALAAETAGISELLAAALQAGRLGKAADEIGELIVRSRAEGVATKSDTPNVQPGAASGKLDAIANQPIKKLELDGNGGTREVVGLTSKREAQYQRYLDRKAKQGKPPLPREQWERKVENLERNIRKGDEWDGQAAELFGYSKEEGYEKQYSNPDIAQDRVFDYGKPGDVVEIKSGRLDPAQLPKDEAAVRDGNNVTYHMKDRPSNADLAWLEHMRTQYPGRFNYTVGEN